MKRSVRTLAVVMALGLIASACSSSSGADTITEGVLTVCTDSPYPPMEFERDGEFVGFDMDLMRAIADEMGLTMTVNNTGFDPITSGIAMEAGDCDIAAASITITPEREQNIDFSDAYFTADQSLLVKNDSGITSLSDFSGRRLGVQTGTTGELYAQDNAAGAELVSFENPGDLFTALEAGDIEGVLQDIIPNADQALNDPTVAVIETYPTAEEYGFAVQEEGKENLLTSVNDALATLKSNGSYDRIYDEWFAKG